MPQYESVCVTYTALTSLYFRYKYMQVCDCVRVCMSAGWPAGSVTKHSASELNLLLESSVRPALVFQK